MRAEEFITESLSTPYQFQYNGTVEWGDKISGKYIKGITASFKTEDGQDYKVIGQRIGDTKAERDIKLARRAKQKAEKERYDAARAANPDEPQRKKRFTIRPPSLGAHKGGMWEIHFYNENYPDMQGSLVTGDGDAFRVFATVIEIVKRMLADAKPEIVSIKSKADEPSRTKLYNRLIDRLAPELGYNVDSHRTVTVAGEQLNRIGLKRIKTIDN